MKKKKNPLIGKKVPVYEDPITCKKLEGEATILKVHDSPEDYYTVRFADGDVVDRTILGLKP